MNPFDAVCLNYNLSSDCVEWARYWYSWLALGVWGFLWCNIVFIALFGKRRVRT